MICVGKKPPLGAATVCLSLSSSGRRGRTCFKAAIFFPLQLWNFPGTHTGHTIGPDVGESKSRHIHTLIKFCHPRKFNTTFFFQNIVFKHQ